MTKDGDEEGSATPADPPRPRVAASLRTARPGDLVPMTSRGEVMSRRAYRMRLALGWAWFAVVVAAVGGFWGGLLHSTLVGVVAAAGTAALTIGPWWRTRRVLLRATALLAAGRPAEARTALGPSPRSRRDARSAFARDYLELRIDWALGDHAAALERCNALVRRFPRSSRVLSERAFLLASMGKADAAIAALAASPAPIGVHLALSRAAAELRIAFLMGELPASFDSEGLHALAREVLHTSLFGGLCVLLAWAFEKRGDADMARHLLTEAPARLVGVDLSKMDPPLAAWFAASTTR